MQPTYLFGLVVVIFLSICQIKCLRYTGHAKDNRMSRITNFMGFSSNLLHKPLNLVPFIEIPLYQFVEYITNETEKHDPKVRDVHIKHFYFYTHIYLASLHNADREFSLVSPWYKINASLN